MSMNILLIEDDEDLHAAIREYLEDRRHCVTACRTVAEAGAVLARLADCSLAPDAIVADSKALGFYMNARTRFPDMRWILTAPKRQVAKIGNPLTAALEVSSNAGASEPVSPRLTDRFMPASAARVEGQGSRT